VPTIDDEASILDAPVDTTSTDPDAQQDNNHRFAFSLLQPGNGSKTNPNGLPGCLRCQFQDYYGAHGQCQLPTMLLQDTLSECALLVWEHLQGFQTFA
jgi:hypothetical protein